MIYPDGKIKDIVKSSKDEKTGIVTIKKDMISPDGTKTQYLYEDDPQGNRIIDYKITDNNGKVLYQNSQTFEKVTDTKFISSNDGRKYEINIDNQSISVKDTGLGKEETIKFKKKIEKFNREEMINLLKKVPGNMLMEAAQDVKKYNGLQKDEATLAYSIPSQKIIASADNLFIFLHELGHIKDSETLKSKDRIERHNEEMQYSGNKKIQNTYMEELSNFVKKYPHEQRKEAGYFLENEGHYGDRTLDIDISFYDDLILNDEDLIIPHKFFHKRAFTLVPMLELAPDFVHPTLKKTMMQLYQELENPEMVFLYGTRV